MVVLLIDDDHDDQLFFGLAISELETPISLLSADDGIKGLSMLANPEFRPDFIFVDMNMPKMTGLECVTKIREIERLNDIPVFVYTTTADPHITKSCLERGATGVLKKQITISTIQETLRSIFENRLVTVK